MVSKDGIDVFVEDFRVSYATVESIRRICPRHECNALIVVVCVFMSLNPIMIMNSKHQKFYIPVVLAYSSLTQFLQQAPTFGSSRGNARFDHGNCGSEDVHVVIVDSMNGVD